MDDDKPELISTKELAEIIIEVKKYVEKVDVEDLTNGFKSPVYGVQAVPIEKVVANDYNPNKVAPPEFKLLELSIWEDGYTQPIVTYYDAEKDKYIVVDGFHRYQVMKTSNRIFVREKGLLPVVVIDKPIEYRIASTIRHNRARGTHDIDLMSDLVAELHHYGKSDTWIAKNLGMDADEVDRLKQIGGLADLFRDKDFSRAWDIIDEEVDV
jgi:ParB-like chromosome segregation protein Spo0J